MTEHNGPSESGPGSDALARMLARAGARPAIDPALRERVERATREHWQRQLRRHRQRRHWLALAASCALVAVLGGVLWRWAPGLADPTLALTIDRLEGSASLLSGGRRLPLATSSRLRKGDGIELGPGATLALRDALGGALRIAPGSRLLLQGERRIDLQHGALYVDNEGATGSWRLSTPLLQARDIGTRFLLQHRAATSLVAVRDGQVEVGMRQGGSERVDGGQRLQVASDGEVRREADPGHGADWSWVADAAVPPRLEGQPVGEFLRWYANEAGLRLVVADDAALAARLDAPLRGSRPGLAVREWLELAPVAAGFRLTVLHDRGELHVHAAD